MTQILISSFLLSIVHALIPNHWMPLIFIGRAEKWQTRETLTISFIAGLAHTLSTILIGILIGVLGFKLAAKFEIITTLVAPLILIGIGLFFLLRGFFHHHHHDHFAEVKRKSGNKNAIILSLLVAMFFSPCLEIEAYYFTAGAQGWLGIATVSAVYLFITVGFMVLLTYFGIKSLEKVNFTSIEKHEKKITGVVLIILGLFNFFIH